MKRKIVLSLLLLFLISGSGAVLSTLFISNTTSTLSRLIKLHQIEDLRQHLIMSIQTVQSDLYTVGTSLGKNLDSIIENVSALDRNSQNCFSCHHDQEVEKNLRDM